MSRAPWVAAQAREGASRPATQTLHSTTLGWRMVNPRDARAVDDLARRRARRSSPACTASAREAQDAFALRSHRLTAAAWDDGFYDDWVVAGARHRARRATRTCARTRSLEKLAKLKPAFVDGRHGDRRQRVAAQRRRGRAVDRRRGRRRSARPRAAGPDRRPRRARASTPTCSGSARSRRPNRALAARRHRLGRRRRRRAQRGVRRAVARLPGASGRSSTPRSSTSTAARSPSATRSARRARASSARSRTSCAAAAAATGVAAICIGVGQGLAVVLDA